MKDDDELDLSQWDVDEPPADFAERVVNAARREASSERTTPTRNIGRTRRRRWVVGATVALGLAASALFYVTGHEATRGEASADGIRKEVKIGDRAVAVLEPGASVKWNGSEVEQSRGGVFYRVERGDGFRVHTTAGDVDVQGPCFRVDLRNQESEMKSRDWKVGAVGALAATAMLVAVYEGKVAVSHAQERVTLSSGQSATASDADGVQLTGASLSGTGNAASTDEALENANRNLVGSVGDYKKRLETIEAQKKDLETKLVAAEKKLEAEQRGSDAAPKKSEFDLSQDELVALAKEGTLKYMSPCSKKDYRPDAETLQKLGLAPQDGDTLVAAYKKVGQWRDAQMRPACQEVIGKSELSDRIPVDGCMHLVSDLLGETDPKERREAQQLATDIRAGIKPPPGPNDKVSPLTRMMLASVNQMKVFEDELAKSFGPEEAHRIAYSEGLCMGRSTWGGGKK
jgi:hypothetical protein